ncbi:hypothetical protein [Streptomyces sp. NPDC051286]|uniref:hypothetical protein n=1 Tax=Streptomyces sp. NPDC051286 TaxID=3365647 RepID=UPI00379B2A19
MRKTGATKAMRYDQSWADKLDEAMLEVLLAESAVESLGQWLADPERGQRYANGSGPAWLGGQPEDSDARPDPRLRREAGDIGPMAVYLVDQTRSA